MQDIVPRLISFLGLWVMLVLAWLLSENRRRIHVRLIVTGIVFQLVFALLILKTNAGRMVFDGLQRFVNGIIACGKEGSVFLFGDGFQEHFFAFSVLPLIIFFSCLTGVLFYWGVIQKIVKMLAWSMVRVMDVSGSESLAAAANVFLGHTEAPLLVRPYLSSMTRSELMAMLTGGMATIAGSVMAAYVGLGIDAGHLLAASIMSAPASLVIAKIMVPEREDSPTRGHVRVEIPRQGRNVIDAACNGASVGLKLALNVGAMVLAFVCLIALVNWGLERGHFYYIYLTDGAEAATGLPAASVLTFQKIIGWIFYPLAWVMGIPREDVLKIASILGEKTVLNEFIAYMDLADMKGQLSPRSFTIATYALCGFANFGSVAIQIGGIGAMVPSRREDIAQLSLRSMVGGTLAAFTTACIVGMLIPADGLPASVIRIDGRFEDWQGVEACASDPNGDAEGAFDITKVYAVSQGSVLYLRFDTGRVLNLQNGVEGEGTLLIHIDLPEKRRLTINTRGRRAYLSDDSESQIPWDSLKYIVGPTYAQNEFEIQVDLGMFEVDCGKTVGIHFGGSDELDTPIEFKLSEPSGVPTRRDHERKPDTDVRIVSFNTYLEGLSDPDREEAAARLLSSVDGDVYCFQEEWKTERHGEILDHLMPLCDANHWHTHKVHGCVIASKYPMTILPSKNNRYATARVEMPRRNVFIVSVHLSAMGYIDSREDRLRIEQANDIATTIDEIYAGKYDEGASSEENPAIVILGDYNLVGSRTPLDIIIGTENHGLKNWMTPNLIGESIITWRGGPRASFAPGKLDYVVYSGKTLVPKNGFILDSELLNQERRTQLQLEADDSKVSDHLPITVDFAFSDSGSN